MEEQIKDHEKRISDLEKERIRADERLNNLTEIAHSLLSAIKWVGATGVGIVVPILIYIIEKNLK